MNHQVKSHRLPQKCQQLETSVFKSVGGKGLRSKYDDEIVKSNTDLNYCNLEIQLKVTEVSNKGLAYSRPLLTCLHRN